LESDAGKQFMAAAQEVDDFRFGVSSDAEVLKEYGVTDAAVILLKKFDDPKVELKGDITSEAIVKFVKTESLPLVIEFNHESAQKIFGGEIKNHLLVFAGKSNEKIDAIKSAAKEGKFRCSFSAISGQFYFRSKLKVKSKVQFRSNFRAVSVQFNFFLN